MSICVGYTNVGNICRSHTEVITDEFGILAKPPRILYCIYVFYLTTFTTIYRIVFKFH